MCVRQHFGEPDTEADALTAITAEGAGLAGITREHLARAEQLRLRAHAGDEFLA